MIPKKIHYIWLGGKEKSNFINSCIVSWKKMMPDYEIIEWNENNLDIESIRKECRFFDECYKRKAYAYMSDYLRFKILYENGGIYFDTDVQVLKSFDNLLNNNFIAANVRNKNVESAIIGCEKTFKLLERVLEIYKIEIFNIDIYTSPSILTKAINESNEQIQLLPEKYLYPFYFDEIFRLNFINENTYTIHWWAKSWTDKKYNIFLNTKHIKNPLRKYFLILKKTIGYYKRKVFKHGK